MKKGISSADFRSFQQKTRLHGKFFTLALGSLPNSNALRSACVVSKKVSPRATERNTVKRRCREALRREKALRGTYVLYAKPTARAASFQEIAHDINTLLARARLAKITVTG